MATQLVRVCTKVFIDPYAGEQCSSLGWVESYVITPDVAAQLELLTKGGFDSDTFSLFFGGTIGLFIVGFTTGIIISQIRKARR